jgi:hypothetical protein
MMTRRSRLFCGEGKEGRDAINKIIYAKHFVFEVAEGLTRLVIGLRKY